MVESPVIFLIFVFLCGSQVLFDTHLPLSLEQASKTFKLFISNRAGVRKTQRKLNHNDLFEPTPLTLPLHSSLLAAKHNVVSITEKNTLWSQR